MLYYKEINENDCVKFIYLISQHTKLQLDPELALQKSSWFNKLSKTSTELHLSENLSKWISEKIAEGLDTFDLETLFKICYVDKFTNIKLLPDPVDILSHIGNLL